MSGSLPLSTAPPDEWLARLEDAERRAAELQRFLHLPLEMLCVADADGYFRRLSPAWETVLGYTEAELRAEPFLNFVHPDDREATVNVFKGLFDGREVVGFENRYRAKDGTYRWLQWHSSALDDGKVYAIARDVTARRAAEVAALCQSELLQGVFDHIPLLIIVLASDGATVMVNRACERILGWGLADFQARDLVPELYPDRGSQRSFRDALSTAPTGWREFRTTTRDRRVLVTLWAFIRLSDGSTVAIAQDATEQKRLQTQFLRAQRRESIGTLIGGVAHDLNNTLTPLRMALDLLKLDLTDDDRRSLLRTVESSVERSAEIVQQLVMYTRGSEGERRSMDLSNVIGEVDRMLTYSLPKTIQLSTAVADDLWRVTANATQMHQLLVNLCLNARDAMPRGGKLSLSATNVQLDAVELPLHPRPEPGRYVKLTVADTGKGIPEAILHKIFDPFFTTKELGQGTGLGLFSVQGIVQSHHGFLDVESEPGKGTRFDVYLPAEGSGIGSGARAEEALPRGQGQLVLVADGEEAIRRVATATLEAFGYTVVTAADGVEAVAAFAKRSGQIAVVLLDLALSGMDGPTVIRVLKQIDPQVKVIAASGVKSGDSVSRTGPVAERLLAKPYTTRTLLMALAEVLVGQRS